MYHAIGQEASFVPESESATAVDVAQSESWSGGRRVQYDERRDDLACTVP